MSGEWKDGVKAIADALNGAQAIVLFGFCGVSLEDQHRAFQLARTLGAYVSVGRPLLPTLTRGSLKQHALILLAGGEPDVSLPEGAKHLRDDRLLTQKAWRCLRVLQRGRAIAGADAYMPVYEEIVSAGGAAFLPAAGRIGDALRTELLAFRRECDLPRGLDWIQLSGERNLLGTYETALEEAGGAHASFAGGAEKADDAYALPELLRQGAVGAALLIGGCAGGAEDVLAAGVPLYALGAAVPGAKICVPAEQADGGTYLRDDGVPLSMPATQGGELPKLREALAALTMEVRGC